MQAMPRRSDAASRLERANEPAVLILTGLASGPKHGYALTKDIESFAGVHLGPGTLYGAITRLEERGLIEPEPSDSRRRPYRITGTGRAALAEAVREMESIANEGAARLRRTGPVLSRRTRPASSYPADWVRVLSPGWSR